MCCFYHTSNTINLVSATKYSAFWIIEYRIFMKDLVDCSATTHGSFSPNTSLRLRSSKVDMLLDIVFSVSDRRSRATRPSLIYDFCDLRLGTAGITILARRSAI